VGGWPGNGQVWEEPKQKLADQRGCRTWARAAGDGWKVCSPQQPTERTQPPVFLVLLSLLTHALHRTWTPPPRGLHATAETTWPHRA
jgi:hypothetical protein